jgi:hypothetical protein
LRKQLSQYDGSTSILSDVCNTDVEEQYSDSPKDNAEQQLATESDEQKDSTLLESEEVEDDRAGLRVRIDQLEEELSTAIEISTTAQEDKYIMTAERDVLQGTIEVLEAKLSEAREREEERKTLAASLNDQELRDRRRKEEETELVEGVSNANSDEELEGKDGGKALAISEDRLPVENESTERDSLSETSAKYHDDSLVDNVTPRGESESDSDNEVTAASDGEEAEVKAEQENDKAEIISTDTPKKQDAGKFIKMREEYEGHVSRLMTKLTKEQEARTQLENRLEDALNRLYRQPKSAGTGFLSGFFSTNSKDDEGSSRARKSGKSFSFASGGMKGGGNKGATTASETDLNRFEI